MGNSSSSIPPEQLLQCKELDSILADAWTKSNNLKLSFMTERVNLRWINAKGRATSGKTHDPESMTAERALASRLATLHHIVCAEREEIVKIVQFKWAWFQSARARSLNALKVTHLRNETILRFVSRYSSYGHNLQGCWADEQMRWIESLTGWTLDEMIFQVKDKEEDWKEDSLRFTDLYSRFTGLAI